MIKLDVVDDILDGCKDLIHTLEGIDLDDPGSVENKRAYAADVTRDLLFLADQLTLASVLVKNEYWHAKGYDEARRARPVRT